MATIKLSPKSISLWVVAITTIIPTVVGGVSKGVDIVRYNIMKHNRNSDEAFGRHLRDEHLVQNGDKIESSINAGDSTIVTWLYNSDKCVMVRRIDEQGRVSQYKLLPHPDKIDKIAGSAKNNYIMSEAFAYEASFTFGYHAKDFNFTEQFFKSGGWVKVVRTYGDGCTLEYYIDVYGITSGWQWTNSKHSNITNGGVKF